MFKIISYVNQAGIVNAKVYSTSDAWLAEQRIARLGGSIVAVELTNSLEVAYLVAESMRSLLSKELHNAY